MFRVIGSGPPARASDGAFGLWARPPHWVAHLVTLRRQRRHVGRTWRDGAAFVPFQPYPRRHSVPPRSAEPPTVSRSLRRSGSGQSLPGSSWVPWGHRSEAADNSVRHFLGRQLDTSSTQTSGWGESGCVPAISAARADRRATTSEKARNAPVVVSFQPFGRAFWYTSRRTPCRPFFALRYRPHS